MRARDLAFAAGGALMAALPLVAYYEGKGGGGASPARVDEPRMSGNALRSGPNDSDDRARVAAGANHATRDARSPTDDRMAPADTERVHELGEVQRQLEQVNTTLRGVRQEKRTLEAQLRTLSADLATQQGEPEDEFDLSQDDWKQLAAESRIKYRVPCMVPPGGTLNLPPETLDELGLTPEDDDALTEAHRRSNARVWSVVRPLCLDVVGLPDVVDLLSLTNCVRVVEQAAWKRDLKTAMAARQQVAEVHAGMRSAPDPSLAEHPMFVANMALTSESRLFEADLAESFGPDEARRFVSSMPCSSSKR